jgi:hypothetical protein
MKGKNFSCNNATGKRRKSDDYQTPYSLTRLFLSEVNFPEPILEPASGNGAIVKVLKEYGYKKITAYDLLRDKKDFLKETKKYSTIITNPPYSKAFEFIQQAKKLSNRFIFLLPLSYLHGKKRYDEIYKDTDYPLTKVFVFTRYPMLGDKLREDGKHRTGMMVYAFFVWEKGAQYKRPSIYWLDNNDYVIRGKE